MLTCNGERNHRNRRTGCEPIFDKISPALPRVSSDIRGAILPDSYGPPHRADCQEGAMRGEGPRGGFSIAAPGHSHRWLGIPCLPRECCGLGRFVCLLALALLVSAISPVDDSVQPDFPPHSSNWHRIVTASKLAGPSHLIRGHCAATPIRCGASVPVLHSADHAIPVPHARLSSPGFRRSHAGRAPPARVFC
jgi:hypothetical protein